MVFNCLNIPGIISIVNKVKRVHFVPLCYTNMFNNFKNKVSSTKKHRKF